MKFNFTKFLPIESYTLTSSLSIDEILKRISENTEPKKASGFSFFNKNPAKPYQGTISSSTFQINRILDHRNSFLPFITGLISNNLEHRLIKITMRPFKPVIIFMCFWLSFIGGPCLSFLLKALFKSEKVLHRFFTSGMYFFLLMFLFGWCLMFFAFKSESKLSKQFLASLLQGEEIDNP